MPIPAGIRLAARTLIPQRNWHPVDAWNDTRYDRFFKRHRTPEGELAAQRIAAEKLTGPLFSIVVPLFKTPTEYLADMVNSVLAQTYPNFELVLVNASPEYPDLGKQIADYAVSDSRIKIVSLDGNRGITENTNCGISAAQGEFICFLDHDDWIEPDTLFEYAAAINEHADTDLIYCDEDMVEKHRATWHHCNPLFKPDFSPELLLCKNYIVHFLAVRKSVIAALPVPGSEFDGAQDYNLTLRASEVARHVHHVPKVLYHWRISAQSTATNSNAKPYGKRAYRRSVHLHLERTHSQGSIISAGAVNNYIIWFHPNEQKTLSLIVADKENDPNTSQEAFIDAFLQVNTYDAFEIVMVGKSGQPQSDASNRPGMAGRIRYAGAQEATNLLGRFNCGATAATGDYLMFLDSSCVFMSAEPVEQIMGLLNRAGAGIVAPKTAYADLTVKAYGIGVSSQGIVPLYRGYPLSHPSYQCNAITFLNTSAVGYQGLSISRALFEKVGGFDEDDFTGEIGSAALCRKVLEKGRRVVATCAVTTLTSEMPTARPYDESRNRPDFPLNEIERFYEKWPSARNETDPYRSPFLDLGSSYPIIDYNRVDRI